MLDDDQPLVQVRWKYYALPTAESGGRAALRLDDIDISADRVGPVVDPPVSTLAATAAGYRLTSKITPGSTATLLTSPDLAGWTAGAQATANASGVVTFDIPRAANTRQFFLLRLP